MKLSFAKVRRGAHYSRLQLASLWGYASYHAIARGVVTPRSDNKIVLFVTESKQRSAEQYQDRLRGNVLLWEGPRDGFAEERMRNASMTGDEIHVFYREKHHSDFAYLGEASVARIRKRGTSTIFKLKLS